MDDAPPNDSGQKPKKARDRATPEPRRPAFANDFPREPALDALVAAFADGNYAKVRADAPALAKATEDDAVKRAAKLLVARTEPDSLAVWMLALTALLLVGLTGWWIVHGHAPKAAPQPPPMIEHVK